jgi:hypothetical protein
MKKNFLNVKAEVWRFVIPAVLLAAKALFRNEGGTVILVAGEKNNSGNEERTEDNAEAPAPVVLNDFSRKLI